MMIWFVVTFCLILVAASDANADQEMPDMKEFCAKQDPVDRETEKQLLAIYEKYLDTFTKDDNLWQLIWESSESMYRSLKRARKSPDDRKNVVVAHKKRVCNMHWIIEESVGTLDKV